MGVIGGLKSKLDSKLGPVQRHEAELARLNASGAELVQDIARLAAIEDDVEDADELAKALVATRAARNKLRKIDEQIVTARARLDLARDEVRRKLLDRLQAEHDRAAADFFEAASVARTAADRVIAAREALLNHGFNKAHSHTPVIPLMGPAVILEREVLDTYGRMLKGESHPWAPQSAIGANVRAVRKPPAPVERQSAWTYLRPQRPKTNEVRALLRETAGEGEVLVSINRAGVEHWRTGQQLTVGDVIAVSTATANALEKHGAAFPTTAEDVAKVDADGPGDPKPIPDGPWQPIDSISGAALAHRASTEVIGQ